MKISFWIKRLKRDLADKASESQTVTKKNRPLVEKILLFRLKILGFILLAISIAFFFYALFYSFTDQPLPSFPSADECSADETLNFFVVSFIFFILAIISLRTALKKNKKNMKK